MVPRGVVVQLLHDPILLYGLASRAGIHLLQHTGISPQVEPPECIMGYVVCLGHRRERVHEPPELQLPQGPMAARVDID